jgi:integrase
MTACTAADIMRSDADGVHVLSFGQAQERARKWFADLALRDREGVQIGPLTVQDCIGQYLDWMGGHRKSGKDSRYRAEALILPALGSVLCNELTTAQLQRWLGDLANSPALLRSGKDAEKRNMRVLDKSDPEAIRKRRASANRVLVILKAALNRAWRAGQVRSDDAWRRVEPFEQANAARVRYLTTSEGLRLVNACGSDFRLLVKAALATGARYGELAALRAADFNLDAGTVHIRDSKSGKARHIVLNDEGAAWFRSLAAGKPGDAFLLAKADGSAWKKAHQAEPMAKACEHAAISPAATFHVLRHTYASLSIMNGVPLMVVARNLGHSDTRMVEKHYGHLAQSYVADAIRAGAPRFGIEPEHGVTSLDERRGAR